MPRSCSAAADVYKIKFEFDAPGPARRQAAHEIRREQDAIAALRAQWSKLDSPARIQDLVRRHLALRPVEPQQYDRLDNLPERRPDLVPAEEKDPIGLMLAHPRFSMTP